MNAQTATVLQERDRRIIAMWREGKHPRTIAWEIGSGVETVSGAIWHHIKSSGAYPPPTERSPA